MLHVMTTDHPAWNEASDGTCVRLVRAGAAVWLATWGTAGLDLRCVDGPEDRKPVVVTTDPADLPDHVPAGIRAPLGALGVTHRLANPWLWDALTTAILRKVIRAAQARALYRRWCQAYGTSVESPYGTLTFAPGPERVLALADGEFDAIGAKFHRPTLRAAAAAYREHASTWAMLPLDALIPALQTIAGVGPWVASAAASDFTGDFARYPHGDLAVRTWAAALAPDHAWPTAAKAKDAEKAFERHWLRMAGAGDRRALHTLTLTTLTWGSHVRLPHQE